jgi:hypothetical protein
VKAARSELIALIDQLPDRQVDELLGDARRLADAAPGGSWPPAFVGMIDDGPENGSTPQYIDSVLAGGFGGPR